MRNIILVQNYTQEYFASDFNKCRQFSTFDRLNKQTKTFTNAFILYQLLEFIGLAILHLFLCFAYFAIVFHGDLWVHELIQIYFQQCLVQGWVGRTNFTIISLVKFLRLLKCFHSYIFGSLRDKIFAKKNLYNYRKKHSVYLKNNNNIITYVSKWKLKLFYVRLFHKSMKRAGMQPLVIFLWPNIRIIF